jgi:rRNA-processing protein FCF1
MPNIIPEFDPQSWSVLGTSYLILNNAVRDKYGVPVITIKERHRISNGYNMG